MSGEGYAEEGSTVRRLNVEPVTPRERRAADLDRIFGDKEATAPTSPPSKSYETAIAVLQAGAFALSARALLLIALLGAFALAWQAMASQTTISIVVLAIYGLFAILPVAYLEARRGRHQ
jgi:hypothetical protein